MVKMIFEEPGGRVFIFCRHICYSIRAISIKTNLGSYVIFQ